jgi:hypothetical protein
MPFNWYAYNIPSMTHAPTGRMGQSGTTTVCVGRGIDHTAAQIVLHLQALHIWRPALLWCTLVPPNQLILATTAPLPPPAGIMDGNAPPALAYANLAASLNVLAPMSFDGSHGSHGGRRPGSQHGPAGGGTKRQATGRTCLECGATSTPQWREGPMGECACRG